MAKKLPIKYLQNAEITTFANGIFDEYFEWQSSNPSQKEDRRLTIGSNFLISQLQKKRCKFDLVLLSYNVLETPLGESLLQLLVIEKPRLIIKFKEETLKLFTTSSGVEFSRLSVIAFNEKITRNLSSISLMNDFFDKKMEKHVESADQIKNFIKKEAKIKLNTIAYIVKKQGINVTIDDIRTCVKLRRFSPPRTDFAASYYYEPGIECPKISNKKDRSKCCKKIPKQKSIKVPAKT
ncbi:hypothetical protein Ciccas_006434, partial [Cichlidogyrus casuarinus]